MRESAQNQEYMNRLKAEFQQIMSKIKPEVYEIYNKERELLLTCQEILICSSRSPGFSSIFNKPEDIAQNMIDTLINLYSSEPLQFQKTQLEKQEFYRN